MNFVDSDFVNLLTIKMNGKTRRLDQTSQICVSSLTAYLMRPAHNVQSDSIRAKIFNKVLSFYTQFGF